MFFCLCGCLCALRGFVVSLRLRRLEDRPRRCSRSAFFTPSPKPYPPLRARRPDQEKQWSGKKPRDKRGRDDAPLGWWLPKATGSSPRKDLPKNSVESEAMILVDSGSVIEASSILPP